MHRLLTVFCATSLLLGSVACNSDTSISRGFRDLTITPGLLEIPATPLGGSSSAVLLIDNTGDAAVNIASLSIQSDAAGAFALEGGGAATLARGDSIELSVLFTPPTVGGHEALLVIASDSDRADSREVIIRGIGAAPALQVYPLVLDFGVVAPPDLVALPLTLSADGLVPVSVTQLELSGEGGAYSLYLPAAQSELPIRVFPGSPLDLTVEFLPVDGEPASALLRIFSDDALVPQLPIALLGNVCDQSSASSQDGDGDGVSLCGGDCDDSNPSIFPGASEVLDGVDNNCEGTVDEGTTAYDDDGDGLSEDEGDCDDSDADSHPGADELSDGRDNDCDGTVDDGTPGLDDDGDGFAEIGGDCEDGDPLIHPGAPELADGIDNDCDGVTDEGTELYDDDGDGFTELAGDCHDGDATIFPGASEQANGVDDDCDSTVDEGTSWYDDDGDGFTEAGGDCDDAAAAVHPGQNEDPSNGVDDDCDGVVD